MPSEVREKCKHLCNKIISDNWGVHKEEWCKTFKQFLVMTTCIGCPDYESIEEIRKD